MISVVCTCKLLRTRVREKFFATPKSPSIELKVMLWITCFSSESVAKEVWMENWQGRFEEGGGAFTCQRFFFPDETWG